MGLTTNYIIINWLAGFLPHWQYLRVYPIIYTSWYGKYPHDIQGFIHPKVVQDFGTINVMSSALESQNGLQVHASKTPTVIFNSSIARFPRGATAMASQEVFAKKNI